MCVCSSGVGLSSLSTTMLKQEAGNLLHSETTTQITTSLGKHTHSCSLIQTDPFSQHIHTHSLSRRAAFSVLPDENSLEQKESTNSFVLSEEMI